MFNTIMVSYDESPEAAHALASAIELAALVRAHLKVVAVVDGQWRPICLPIYNFGWVEQDHDVMGQKADSVDAEPWCHAFYDKTNHFCTEWLRGCFTPEERSEEVLEWFMPRALQDG